ncbi:MAG: sulfatase-like hydrolase/transferase [Saprospiraceae bacterium]|nr:sulfatase-like hydrolase/transferase [Saprospiraceae bacterium]
MTLARKKTLSLVAFSLLVFVTLAHAQKSATTQPNILLILVDDLGKEWISCYGAEDIETPHIDELAEQGTKFERFYVMPQCTPTRVSLLTGQYPFRHGWVNHWDVPRWGAGAHFDEKLNPALPLQLKKAGYQTCIAGKWQIDDFRVEPDALAKVGFDTYCMWTGGETGIPASNERYGDPYIYENGKSQTHEGAFGPDVFKDFIIDFIVTHRDQPMFIYYPMVLTHTPFVDTPDEKADDNLGKHKAMVRYADKITGELVAALESADIREKTLVLWTTDNGTTGQISGHVRGELIKGGKSKTQEPGISVPFIASWPDKVAAGKTSSALIDITDVLPTCIQLAGLTPPNIWETSHGRQTIDGRSFANVLVNGSDASDRTWILSMGGGNFARRTELGVENQYRFRDRVISSGALKLYYGADRNPSACYDLTVDPFEKKNILNIAMDPGDKAQLDLLLEVCEQFPAEDRDPQYQPNPAQSWDVPITAESQQWKQ